jgi:beta-galactosidase/beta-glucuronidase
MKTIDLAGDWTLKRKGDARFGSVPCAVPGGVLAALRRAGRIPDPLAEGDAGPVRAAAEATWILSRTVEAGDALLAHDFVDLELDGVDTLATVSVNGHVALRCDNAFRPWRADVRRLLRPGPNTVAVTLRPAAPENAPHKPALASGTPWSPPLPDCGLPLPVRLRAWNRARISEIGFGQKHAASGPVELLVGGWIETAEDVPLASLAVFVRVRDPGGAAVWEGPGEIPPGGDGAFHAAATIREPRLWWPAGLGPQPLYAVEVELRERPKAAVRGGGRRPAVPALDRAEARVGLRTLVPVARPGGASALSCNGRAFFLRGAVWAPPSPADPPFSREDLEPFLAGARDAHFNALRLAAGCPPPPPAFWDLCDEYGIVALGAAPLGERAAAETGASALAGEEPPPPPFLRHACVPDTLLGEPDEESGLRIVRACVSWPAPETLAAAVPAAARNLTGPAMTRRAALRGGPSALVAALAARWPLPASPDGWLVLSQLAQAADVRARIAAARTEPGATGLLWEPFVSSWAAADAASIDAAGRWKALQYEAARAFAPEALFARRGPDGRPAADYVNATAAPRRARLSWRLTTMDGSTLAEGGSRFLAEAQSVQALPLPDVSAHLAHYGADDLVLWLAALDADGYVLARDHLLFADPRFLRLQDPTLAVDVAPVPDVDGEQVLKATVSVSAPAFWIRLELPGVPALFGDGFFALEPDETLDVFVTPLERTDPATVRRRLVARSLYDLCRRGDG